MFGHKAMMFKRGCYEMTGDLTNNGGASGEFAVPQTEPETGTDDAGDDTGGETGADDDVATADNAGQQAEEDAEGERTSKQPPEVDAAFAKLRREAEEAKRQLEERDRWVSETFGKTHGIHTWEQYQQAIEYQRQQEQMWQYQQIQQELEEQGVPIDVINRALEMNPVFQQLRQQNEMYQRQMQMQQVNQAIMNDFSQLKSKYGDLLPDVDTSGDPNAVAKAILNAVDDQTFELMKQGYTLRAAWLMANEDKAFTRATKAAKQAALNSVNSKSHLKSEAGGEVEADIVNLDPEELAKFRAMFPNMSDSDFAYFKKHGKLPKRR